jgi:LacI family transcriptional regulator
VRASPGGGGARVIARRGRSSMREVAERAGVAMSSVSRVLSGHPDVSSVMRERVLLAVDELGYKPDLLAQSMRRRATLSVGFVVGDISNPLLAEIVMAAETALREAGYSMLLTNSEGNPDLDAAHVRLLDQRRVDGLILSLAREGHEPTLAELEALDIPIVVVDRAVAGDLGASSVLSDHRRGMRAAVEHLLDLGHRRIGLVVGQPVRPSLERRAALEETFGARGLPPTFTVHEGVFSVEHGAASMRALLDQPEPPTAVIAAGNQLMLGALKVVSERRLELGVDLSFVGCDDTDIAELYRPPIAVIRRDIFELGRVAAALLLRRLHGDDDASEVVLPTEFVPRPSCGAPRAGA